MAQAKKPSHQLFIVEEYGEGKSHWTEVGVAWKHENDGGFNLQIRPGLAVSGKLVLMPPKAKNAGE